MEVEVAERKRDPEVTNLLDLNEPDSLREESEIEIEEIDDEPEPEVIETKSEKKPQVQEEPQEEIQEDIQEERTKKKPTRLSAKYRRINNEKKAYENAAYTLYDETKSLKEQLAQKDRAISLLREDTLKTRADLARQAYENAREEGDIEKELEAQKYFIQYENELANLKNKTNQTYSEENDDISRYIQYEDQNPINADFEEWVIENDWYDPSSPNVDPELIQEAQQYDQYLAKKYRLQKRSHEIGTREYLDEISRYVQNKYLGNQRIQDEYDDHQDLEEEPMEVKPKAKPRQPVAPVNRAGSSSPYTDKPDSSRKVKLSKEEIEIALSLNYGPGVTPEQKKKLYADSKYELIKAGKL